MKVCINSSYQRFFKPPWLILQKDYCSFCCDTFVFREESETFFCLKLVMSLARILVFCEKNFKKSHCAQKMLEMSHRIEIVGKVCNAKLIFLLIMNHCLGLG